MEDWKIRWQEGMLLLVSEAHEASYVLPPPSLLEKERGKMNSFPLYRRSGWVLNNHPSPKRTYSPIDLLTYSLKSITVGFSQLCDCDGRLRFLAMTVYPLEYKFRFF